MKFFKNFTMKMVKMNFILWKIAIKHNFDWKYFFLFVGCVHIYSLSNKKACLYMCIYNKKVCVCVCIYVWLCVGVVLINILVLQLPPPKTKISGFAPTSHTYAFRVEFLSYKKKIKKLKNNSNPNNKKIVFLFCSFFAFKLILQTY